MTIYFGPNPGTYGVIRMDPVAMVQHLNDPEAMAAAQAMQPKSYLVYLEHILALPFPGQPWFPFTVLVVGPGLRPPNEEECITADMCTPIFPNLAHPTGRASLRTEPTFPYSNCAHWQCPELNVRICARDEGFDDGLAIKLPVDDQEQLELDIVLDQTRVLEARHARNACAQTVPIPVETEDSQPPTSTSACSPSPSSGELQADCLNETGSMYCSSFVSSYVSSPADSFEALLDIFAGNPEDQGELVPLVHLWLDLEGTLKQEDIPNPLELFEERDAIVSIIQRARARNPSLPPPRIHSPFGVESDNGDDASETESHFDHSDGGVDTSGHSRHVEVPMKRRHFRPLKSIRKLRATVARLVAAPYITFWP